MDKTMLIKINTISTMAGSIFGSFLSIAEMKGNALEEIGSDELQLMRQTSINLAEKLYNQTIVHVVSEARRKEMANA